MLFRKKRYLFNRQRNLHVRLMRTTKKKYSEKIYENDYSDNRKFWHTVKPLLQDDVKSRKKIFQLIWRLVSESGWSSKKDNFRLVRILHIVSRLFCKILKISILRS